jgi:PhnB protein
MTIQPYLFFDGRTEEALNFYRSAVGAEIEMLMRFKDSPEKATEGCMPPAGSEDRVMHSSFKIGDTVVMASDGDCKGKASFQGFALSLTAKNEAEAQRFFKGLSDGGQVTLPLTKTFFAKSFGMLSDRFGVMWMVIVPEAMPGTASQKQPAHA